MAEQIKQRFNAKAEIGIDEIEDDDIGIMTHKPNVLEGGDRKWKFGTLLNWIKRKLSEIFATKEELNNFVTREEVGALGKVQSVNKKEPDSSGNIQLNRIGNPTGTTSPYVQATGSGVKAQTKNTILELTEDRLNLFGNLFYKEWELWKNASYVDDDNRVYFSPVPRNKYSQIAFLITDDDSDNPYLITYGLPIFDLDFLYKYFSMISDGEGRIILGNEIYLRKRDSETFFLEIHNSSDYQFIQIWVR